MRQEFDASYAGVIGNTDPFFPLHNARLFPSIIAECNYVEALQGIICPDAHAGIADIVDHRIQSRLAFCPF